MIYTGTQKVTINESKVDRTHGKMMGTCISKSHSEKENDMRSVLNRDF